MEQQNTPAEDLGKDYLPQSQYKYNSSWPRRNWVTILMTIAALIVVGFGIYWLQRLTNETIEKNGQKEVSSKAYTEGWKDYNFSAVDVNIKYPSTWTSKTFTNYPQAVYFEEPKIGENDIDYGRIRLEFITGNKQDVIEESKDSVVDNNQRGSNLNMSVTELRSGINRMEVVGKIKYDNSSVTEDIQAVVYLFDFDEKHYLLLSLDQTNAGSKSEHIKILDGMASSFNKESPSLNIPLDNQETTDWRAYSNEKYGLEFKYPNKWGELKEYTQNEPKNPNNVLKYGVSVSSSNPTSAVCCTNVNESLSFEIWSPYLIRTP